MPELLTPVKFTLSTTKVLVFTLSDDKKGNELTCGLDDTLDVGILGAAGTFENLRSKNNDDGTFTVSLDIKAPQCDYELTLKVNGVEIGPSPWKVQS